MSPESIFWNTNSERKILLRAQFVAISQSIWKCIPNNLKRRPRFSSCLRQPGISYPTACLESSTAKCRGSYQTYSVYIKSFCDIYRHITNSNIFFLQSLPLNSMNKRAPAFGSLSYFFFFSSYSKYRITALSALQSAKLISSILHIIFFNDPSARNTEQDRKKKIHKMQKCKLDLKQRHSIF